MGDGLDAGGFLLRVGKIHRLALVAHQAREYHAGRNLGPLRQFQGRLPRPHPAAPHPYVQFDKDPHADTHGLRRFRDHIDVDGVIDGHHDVRMPLQMGQAGHFSFAHDLVGNQDVLDTRSGHDFGFTEFGAGDTDGSRVEQFVRNGRGFVSLGMRTPANAADFAPSGDSGDVVLQKVQVEHQGRRIQVPLFKPDGRVAHSEFL